MKIVGRLRRIPLGTGQWVVDVDDGRTAVIAGDVHPARDGDRVVVEGDLVDAPVGFGVSADLVLAPRRLEPTGR